MKSAKLYIFIIETFVSLSLFLTGYHWLRGVVMRFLDGRSCERSHQKKERTLSFAEKKWRVLWMPFDRLKNSPQFKRFLRLLDPIENRADGLLVHGLRLN